MEWGHYWNIRLPDAWACTRGSSGVVVVVVVDDGITDHPDLGGVAVAWWGFVAALDTPVGYVCGRLGYSRGYACRRALMQDWCGSQLLVGLSNASGEDLGKQSL